LSIKFPIVPITFGDNKRGFPTLFLNPGIMRVKVHEQVDTLIKLDGQKVNQGRGDIVYSQLLDYEK
jgi:hypothetical protein